MDDSPEKPGCRGVNTFGVDIESHIKVINEQYRVYFETMGLVRRYLDERKLKSQHPDWDKKWFAFLMIKPYCKSSPDMLVPAEFSIVVFSFQDGVTDIHNGFFVIDYDKIACGERGEIKVIAETNGYPDIEVVTHFAVPGEQNKRKLNIVTPIKFMDLLDNLAKKYGLFMDNEFLLFTTRSDIPVVHCCLNWIRSEAGWEDTFHVVSFEVLLKELSGKMDTPDVIGVIKHEGGAGRFIYHSRYDFNSKLSCAWHRYDKEANEKIDRCTNSIALRRVYNALYYLCQLFDKPLKETTHAPPQFDSKGSLLRSVENY